MWMRTRFLRARRRQVLARLAACCVSPPVLLRNRVATARFRRRVRYGHADNGALGRLAWAVG